MNNPLDYITTKNITFLVDIDKTINIQKSGKYKYHSMFGIEIKHIREFIFNLEDEQVYIILPFLSVDCKLNNPYCTLSRQFLVSNRSSPQLIYDYINHQFNIGFKDFNYNFENDYFHLIFKHKKVSFDSRTY